MTEYDAVGIFDNSFHSNFRAVGNSELSPKSRGSCRCDNIPLDRAEIF